MILGLTGSLGSGKSTVAEMFRNLGGAVVIDADEITHRLQQPEGEEYRQIVARFGAGVVKADGGLDRKQLAALIFGNDEKRQLLNSIVHPLVRAEEERLLQQHRHEPLVILMVPLLYEVKMDTMADRVAVVTVSEDERLKRLQQGRGMEPGEVATRLAAQMEQQEKVGRADYVIDNSGSVEATRQQVIDLLLGLGIETGGAATQDKFYRGVPGNASSS